MTSSRAVAAAIGTVLLGGAVMAVSLGQGTHATPATADYLPNHTLTPGATNPDVTQENIKTTICKGGWTNTVRPKSLRVQEKQSLQDYGNRYTTKQVEYDHLISLELGGAPTDPKNLWPEPEVATGPDGLDAGSHIKDNLESFLNAQVCGRRKPFIALALAQQEISGNWYAVYTSLGRPPNPYYHPKK